MRREFKFAERLGVDPLVLDVDADDNVLYCNYGFLRKFLVKYDENFITELQDVLNYDAHAAEPIE